MPKRAWLLVLTLAMAVCLLPSMVAAQLYAADRICGCVYSYQETTATVVGQGSLVINQIGRMSLDHEGRLLIAGFFTPSTYAARLDPDTEEFDLFIPQTSFPDYSPVAIVCEEANDIYVLMRYTGEKSSQDGRQGRPLPQRLHRALA